MEEFGLEPPVMRIEMSNQIPLARGLGSSAAASVAGLLAAEALADEKLPRGRLLALAPNIEDHPDNASAALFGGFVVVGGESPRRASTRPRRSSRRSSFPTSRCARRRCARRCRTTVTHADATHNVGRTAMIVAALASGQPARSALGA